MYKDARCNFCNGFYQEAEYLVAGPMVFICDSCVELAVDIIEDAKKKRLEKQKEVDNAQKET